MSEASVAIVGGINVDTIVGVDRLPEPGETTIGLDLHAGLGGKAANQAIATARTGTVVSLIAAVGDDVQGGAMRDLLTASGVDVTNVVVKPAQPTGSAFILVDRRGENVIVVTPGANARLDGDDIAAATDTLARADVVVVQGEIATGTTLTALDHARRAGTRIVANLAPFFDIGPMLAVADPVVLNEIEASQLLGEADVGVGSEDVVRRLGTMARSAVVTLGAAGALVIEGGKVSHVPAPVVTDPVDTTGAGDAFVGVLSAALAHGYPLAAAAAAAVAAASASVGVRGAGGSYPSFALPPRSVTSA